MLVGYARTSTPDQINGLETQKEELIKSGVEKIYFEHASAKSSDRPELQAALNFMREGDVFMVTRPDRLARSTKDLLTIIDDLENRQIGLVILSMGNQRVDTRTSTGKLMITMIGAVATFERDLLRERQREGIARAKKYGKYKGRKPTARIQSDEVRRLIEEGRGIQEIASLLDMSRSSVYRCLK